jgi:hypothetical protein
MNTFKVAVAPEESLTFTGDAEAGFAVHADGGTDCPGSPCCIASAGSRQRGGGNASQQERGRNCHDMPHLIMVVTRRSAV